MKIYNVSVHELVDYLLRKGDLDDRVFNSTTMNEGSEIHRKYQNSRNSNYLSEIDLKYSIKYGDYLINLHGRADGIIIDKIVTIDEIKTANIDLEVFKEKNEDWHLGQAECYAYMYCKLHNCNKINISLTYISQKNNKKRLSFLYEYNLEKLDAKIHGYIVEYIDFLSIIDKNIEKRNLSIKKIEFPFSYRVGQKEIVDFCINSIRNNEKSFVEASTGLGKTISITFSFIKNAFKTNNAKIFYLAAKNSGFNSALDSLQILRKNELYLISCEIVAKDKICLNKKHNCNPDDCPFAKAYYDKRNAIIKEVLIEYSNITTDLIVFLGKKYNVCPFELSLDLSLFSDFIILDYNYVFSPTGYLKRFFDMPESECNYYALIDEAHNLIDRSRDMYSASIFFNDFKNLFKSLQKIKSKTMKKILENLDEEFSLFADFEIPNDYLSLETLDKDFINHLTEYLEIYRKYTNSHPNYFNLYAKEFNVDVYSFLKIYELFDVNYRIYLKKENEKNYSINLKCLDASYFVADRINYFNSAIFFSATLTPIDYYKTSIMHNNSFKSISVPSPFPINNFKLMVNNNISVRYKTRERSLNDIVKLTQHFVSHKVGNYLVFVPSFKYLEMLKSSELNEDKRFIFQSNRMSNLEKKNFLEQFILNPIESKVGVCVLGGSFSEGIDLKNDRLIGVIVIGAGLPSINYENNLILDHYSNIGLDGFSFTYTYPGINKIMQAVGRLIRSENDKGIALLIDDRLLNKNYLSMYENNWSKYKVIKTLKDLENELISFYEK